MRMFKPSLRALAAAVAGVLLVCGSGVSLAATEAEFDAAYDAMLDDPENLDKIVQFARIATELGEYEVAVGALERLLLYASDSATVRADLGFLYYRLGSYEVAKYYLAEALESGRLSATTAEQVRDLIGRTEDNLNPHSFSASLSFGMRYQTNANSATDNARVLAAGNLVNLGNNNREQDDVDAFVIGRGFYKYNFFRQNKLTFEAPINVFVDRYADDGSLNTLVAAANPGFRFEPDPANNKGVTLFPHLVSRVVQRDDELFSRSFGFGLGLRYASREDLFVAALFRHRRTHFYNSRTRPSAGNRNGYENLLTVGARYRFKRNLFGNLRGYALQRETRRAFNDNWEVGLTGRLVYSYATELFGDKKNVRSYASVGVRDTTYSAPDPTVDPNRSRQETAYRFGLGSTLTLDRSWSVSLEGAVSDVTSNIRNFKRNNLSVSLTATRRF